MRDGHVEVNGGRVRFAFRGKSGVEHEIDLNDRRLARIVKACRDIPGYDLFQYYDENGDRQAIGSADVNAYLQEITGKDFTSKDFRTWAGTVLAAQLLRDFEQFESDAQAKRNIVQAVESVAKRLGNTKAVCRKCYIHPAVFDAYLDGSMLKTVAQRARKAARKIEDLLGGGSRRPRIAGTAARKGNTSASELSVSGRRCGCRRWCLRGRSRAPPPFSRPSSRRRDFSPLVSMLEAARVDSAVGDARRDRRL